MRVQSTALAALAIVASHAAAFKDTAPLLASSSTPNVALTGAAEEITSGVILADEVYGTLATLGCDWDALVVVHVDDLHHSQIPSLTLPAPHKASLRIPYLVRPSSGRLRTAIQSWATECDAEFTESLGTADKKAAVWLSEMPSSLADLGDKQLLIVTGSPSTVAVSDNEEQNVLEVPAHGELRKRQYESFADEMTEDGMEEVFESEATDPYDDAEGEIIEEFEPTFDDVEDDQDSARPSPNDTIPSKDAPLLERVQLLSTPVIMSLLISFGILVPILMFGISALAGIQVPPRMMEISKAMQVGQQKKDQ